MSLKEDAPRAEKDFLLQIMSNKDFRLKSSERLKKRKDFLRIQRFGRRISTGTLALVSLRSSVKLGDSVGFSVSKKVGKAHTRNLIKRRLRHLIRERKFIINGRSVVVMAYPKSADAPFSRLKKDLEYAASKLK